MTILGLVPYRFLPVKIGGQKAIEQFYRSLAQKIPVTLVSTKNNEVSQANHFSLQPLFSNHFVRYADPRYISKIGALILKAKPTHLFIEHPYLGWMAMLLQRRYKLPLVVHSHNIESIRFKSIGKIWWRILWHYEKRVYRSADFVFFMTEEDRQYAITSYGVRAPKAFVASYGTEIKQSPSPEERAMAKRTVCSELRIPIHHTLLFFNGSFDYEPNARALQILLQEILPQLEKKSLSYTLIVCGRNIPVALRRDSWRNVIFLDYVDDIFLYNLAADVFVNPVTEGGGIKTKLVESLAAGANAVSARSGAFGVDPGLCNGKLSLTEDDDREAFAEAVCTLAENKQQMGDAFYRHFYIGHITDRVIGILSGNHHNTL